MIEEGRVSFWRDLEKVGQLLKTSRHYSRVLKQDVAVLAPVLKEDEVS